jgi:hypothetical protein
MIKTIKIAAIAMAVVSVAALVLAVMLGIRTDPAKNKIIAEASVVEVFKKSAASPSTQTKTSPLVTQAQAFQHRINPPPPPPSDPNSKVVGKAARGGTVLPPPPPPTQFEVIATCVNPLDPTKSFALLTQPGKGSFWVRPKDEVSRAVIKTILPGKVITGDGKEYTIPQVQRTSLLKPGSPPPPGYENYAQAAGASQKPIISVRQVTPGVASEVEKPSATPAAAAATESEASPADIKAVNDWIRQAKENPESFGLTKEEAAQLGDLGQVLQDSNSSNSKPEGQPQDPNARKE